MSEIDKLRDLIVPTLNDLPSLARQWEAINTRALADQISTYLQGEGRNVGQAATSAEADVRAVKKVVFHLAEAHAWLATLDNNLMSDRLIT